jgi:hypothetical protein
MYRGFWFQTQQLEDIWARISNNPISGPSQQLPSPLQALALHRIRDPELLRRVDSGEPEPASIARVEGVNPSCPRI